MNRTVLSISHFDPSGATGLAADIKCFQTFRCYGTAAATAVAPGNTTALQGLHPVPMEIVGQQIEAVASDMPVHGVKIGTLVNAAIVQIVASLLPAFSLTGLVVADPVLAASTGEPLLDGPGLEAFKKGILPLASVVTPSAKDAEALTGVSVTDAASAREAARILESMGARQVVLTSIAPESGRSLDLWYDGTAFHLFDAPRIPTRNRLGIGSTFSAILAALLVKGTPTGEAVDRAKKYVAKAVQHPFTLGKGLGPLNHTLPM